MALLFVSCEMIGLNEPSNGVQNGGGEKIATIEEQMAAIEQSIPALKDVVDKAEELAYKSENATRGNDNNNNGVKTLIAELEERIAALEEYINGGGSGEWTDVTYATMEMYEETVAILASLQAEVETLKEQYNTLCGAVSDAVDESVDSMKSWVNELLTGYYDIATVDAMFASLLEELTSSDAEIIAEIESLRNTLNEELASMRKAYNDAIKSAIEENNGLLDENLTKSINDVNSRIDEEVAKLNKRLDDIEERLTKLEGSVSDLLKRIQSVAYVPIYEDGNARVTFPSDGTYGATLQLDFMISPKDAASDLAKVYKEAVSVQVLYTGSPLMTAMPIISCEAVASQGLFSVVCACDDISMAFYNGDVTARAIMYISDGNNDRTSEYITIVPNRTQIQNNQIWYTVSNKLPVEINQGSGPRIVSNEYDSVAGHYVVTFESDIYTIPASYFGGCSELTSVVLPNGVMTIESKAFADCYSLASITLPDSLSYIGSRAFAYTSLYSLALPSSLSGVAPDALLNSNISRLEGDCVADDGISLIFDARLAAIAPAGLGEEYVVPTKATTIGDAVFKGCHTLANITIHDKVTSIGSEAFKNCGSLTSIAIPDSVKSIGSGSFSGCNNLNTITIGAGLTEIVSGLFSNLNNLENITIGSGVAKIGSEAFKNCGSLTSIVIPDSVESIGDGIFAGCTSLKSISLGANIESINKEMFTGCDSIEQFSGKFATEDGYALVSNVTLIAFAKACGIDEYTIPADITYIEECVFANCTNISLFRFESTTPPTLGANVFAGIYNLQISIPVESVEAYLTCDWPYEYRRAIIEFADIDNIPDSYRICYTTNNNQKLGVYSVEDHTVLLHNYTDGVGIVVFFEPLTTIGEMAFEGCSSLTSITIPNSVTSIGWLAFGSCSSLTSITIPDSVTTIGDETFSWCESLTSVTIGNSVTTIGIGAFGDCSSLTSVTIPDSVTTIGFYAFWNCSSLTSVTIGDSVTTIGYSAFDGCSSLTSVTIPDSVTTIGDAIFAGCTSLTSVTIGDSVTTIGSIAFSGCTSLTSVNIPDSVTTIGEAAFRDCTSLTSITIPDSVTTIGNYAFNGCSSLTSVTIGDSVTTIGDYAFCDCYSLTSVYCKAVTPPAGGYEMFSSNASGRKIYVPTESVEAYKSASGWSDYADAIVGYNF